MNGAAPRATHASVHDLAAALPLDEAAYRRAMELAGLVPQPADWLRYLDRFLAAAGAALIVAGIAAFFAWNWSALGHLAKLALLQGGVVTAVALAWPLGLDTSAGRAALVAAGVLVGILLAVFGQAYQTGADPYGLFVAWALLILPWVVVGRQPGLWLLLLVLLNLSAILYWIQVLHPPSGAWELAQLLGPLVMLGAATMDWQLASCLFVLNALALVAWETAARGGARWQQARSFPRIAAVFALATVTVPTLVLILLASADLGTDVNVVSPLLFAAALIACLWYYQFRKADLLMLTAALFGGILVVTALAIRVLEDSFESLLFLALLLIAQVAGAAYWLRHVSSRWEAAA